MCYQQNILYTKINVSMSIHIINLPFLLDNYIDQNLNKYIVLDIFNN